MSKPGRTRQMTAWAIERKGRLTFVCIDRSEKAWALKHDEKVVRVKLVWPARKER
jgi:hypothetical protein